MKYKIAAILTLCSLGYFASVALATGDHPPTCDYHCPPPQTVTVPTTVTVTTGKTETIIKTQTVVEYRDNEELRKTVMVTTTAPAQTVTTPGPTTTVTKTIVKSKPCTCPKGMTPVYRNHKWMGCAAKGKG